MKILRAQKAIETKRLTDAIWPQGLRVAVLGPHPDDFDEAAVTLKLLQSNGATISVAVLSGSAIGVEDSYCAPEQKAETRREEQRRSCRLFGLPDDELFFLPLEEDAAGEPADNEHNQLIIGDWLAPRMPDLIFLPHGHDQKGGHRNVYSLMRAVVAGRRLNLIAMLNRDPKTVSLRIDAFTPYDETTAAWKASLLRCHDTQQQRNLNTRGYGFDDRILGMDRKNAAELKIAEPFAELFEVEIHRG